MMSTLYVAFLGCKSRCEKTFLQFSIPTWSWLEGGGGGGFASHRLKRRLIYRRSIAMRTASTREIELISFNRVSFIESTCMIAERIYRVHYESNAHFLRNIDLLMRLVQMVKNFQTSLLLHQYTCGDDSAAHGMHPGTPQLECLWGTL